MSEDIMLSSPKPLFYRSPAFAILWAVVGLLIFCPLTPLSMGIGLNYFSWTRIPAFVIGYILGRRLGPRFENEDGFWVGAKIGFWGSVLTLVVTSLLNLYFAIVFFILLIVQHLVAACICGLIGILIQMMNQKPKVSRDYSWFQGLLCLLFFGLLMAGIWLASERKYRSRQDELLKKRVEASRLLMDSDPENGPKEFRIH